MQMSDTLALVQVLLGVGSLIVAILAQIREHPPNNGRNPSQNDED